MTMINSTNYVPSGYSTPESTKTAKENAKTPNATTMTQDEVCFNQTKNSKTTQEKQELIKKAKIKAGTTAFLLGLFPGAALVIGRCVAPLVYRLRSDKKVAKKFDLDVEQDKDLIKKVKKEQAKTAFWGLPGLIVTANKNPEKIKVD